MVKEKSKEIEKNNSEDNAKSIQEVKDNKNIKTTTQSVKTIKKTEKHGNTNISKNTQPVPTVKNAILVTDIDTQKNVEAEKVEKKSDDNNNIKTINTKDTKDAKIETENSAIEDEKIFSSAEHTNKASHVLAVLGIIIASLILLTLIVFFIFAITMNNKTTIFSGVYIKNIDVSDLSKSNAKLKLDDYIKSNLPEEITLVHNDYEATLNTEELKVNFDIEDSINTAYNFGRGGNLVTNGFDIISLGFNNKNVDPKFTIDDEILTEMLNDISGKLPDKVIESGYYIDGNSLILNKGTDGVVIDVEKTKSKIKKEIKNLNVLNNKIEIITKNANPKKLDIDKIYEKVHKDAVDATFTSEPLSVTPSENGIDFGISIEEAKDLLENDDQESVIPLKVVYPNVTTNMIGTEAFPDKLSEFSTNYAASNVNRTTNLRLAANKINGTVLMPGEIFSYNQVVGERTIAAGYKEAPIYVSGRVEDGLGGGICQITTTLYNAVVYANLEIVERTNHQFVPSYIGAGKDATVVYGALDFKFKNNRNYPIKIICSVSGGIANFKIFGLSTEDDYNVEIYSKITSQTANSTNSETYKILKKNGAVVDQVLLSRDTYKRH